jgi:3-oxoacyl-(acyl-carrier-protein) synthase
VTSGRRSGLEALLRARTLLRSRRAERVVVAGCDEVSDSLLNGLAARGELATAASGGVRPGEAAVALVLEAGGSTDGPADGAVHPMSLLGQSEASVVGRTLEEACVQAVRRALETADVAASAVEWAALSTCGDASLDQAEEAAMSEIFGDHLRIVRPKEIFGETFGAAGLLGCAAAIVGIDAESSAGPVLVSAVDAGGAMAVLIGRG